MGKVIVKPDLTAPFDLKLQQRPVLLTLGFESFHNPPREFVRQTHYRRITTP